MPKPNRHQQRGSFEARLFGLLCLLLVLGAIGYGFKTQTVASGDDLSASTSLYAGIPVAVASHSRFQAIEHPGHVLGYSPYRRTPLWVAYRVTPLGKHRDLPRPKKYHADPAIRGGVEWHAYKGSGYQRGHLAPNYVISQLYGAEAQRATFFMSNITPQTNNLNQKFWQRLEEVEADEMVRRHRELWVTTGPVFDAKRDKLDSGVEVPDDFYRIWLDEVGVRGSPRVLAFLVPQDVTGYEPLDKFLVSVDEIETRTGLDFFSELPDEQENSIESKIHTGGWGLEQVANQPPRY